MSRRLARTLIIAAALATVWGLAEMALYVRARRLGLPPAYGRYLSAAAYEQWAREEFFRCYPGEKPLNWKIAATAERFYAEKPMGKFVLGVGPGEWGNDCSDFVDCIIDEALGAGARCFRLGARDHRIGESLWYFSFFFWDGRSPVQPGDILSVRHSPWYPPDPEACWHMGVVGADGKVYDFVKLKSWSQARYGKHSFEWFVRHAPGKGQVSIGRLKPQYRYRIKQVHISGSGSDARG